MVSQSPLSLPKEVSPARDLGPHERNGHHPRSFHPEEPGAGTPGARPRLTAGEGRYGSEELIGAAQPAGMPVGARTFPAHRDAGDTHTHTHTFPARRRRCPAADRVPPPPPRDGTVPPHRPTRRGKTALSLSAARVRCGITGGRRGGEAAGWARFGRERLPQLPAGADTPRGGRRHRPGPPTPPPPSGGGRRLGLPNGGRAPWK